MADPPEPQVRTEFRTTGDACNIAWIFLDYPQRLNVFGTPMLQRFCAAVTQVQAQNDLRAVVVTGVGDRSFCGGADVRELAQLNPDSAQAFISRVHDACQAVRDCPVPVIARINGYCLGAGMELAASCDLRVAADNAMFGMPEVQVGVPSVVEAALLPRLIGWGRTSQLLLTGQSITAKLAYEWGFVEKFVEPADLDFAVDELLGPICDAGPQAVRLQKQLMREWLELPLSQAIQAGIATFRRAHESDEPRTRAQRFLDRRKGES